VVKSGAVWAAIHAERRALAADLQTLNEPQWATRSLCAQWSVRDVLAHMTATARMTPTKFFGKLVGSGFSFSNMQARDLAAELGASPAETLARFTSVVDAAGHPPGPNEAWLGETLVHAEDIRRPLEIAHTYPTECVLQVANFYQTSNLLIGAKNRIAGLTLVASDAKWRHGDGPEVTGPIMSLVLAMTGRRAAIEELSGPGVQTLELRCH
jgi:uncharacterized protein (TIGR03083 family)